MARKHKTRGLWAGEERKVEEQQSPGREEISHLCPSLLGFSITKLQREQAMLNASKQQAAWKPKDKQVVVPYPL